MDYEKYTREVDLQRITRGTRDRLEALTSTCEMIEVCLEVADGTIRDARKYLLDNHPSVPEFGDWRTMLTMVRLAGQQNDIIKAAILTFEKEDVRAQAA